MLALPLQPKMVPNSNLTSRQAYNVTTEKDPKRNVQHVAIGAFIAWSFSPHAAAEWVGNFGCLAGWSF